MSLLGVARDLVLLVPDEGGAACSTSSLLLLAEMLAEVFTSVVGVVGFCGVFALG
jgi:hypothetical protein